MATLLARLADAASRRRRLVIGVWLALLLGGSWFSLHQSDRLSGGGWDVPGSSSVRVADELDTFPSFSSPALSILVTGRSRAAVLERLAAARATAARDPALNPKRPHLFDGGRAALLPVTYVGPTGDAIDAATRVRHALVQTTPETQTRLIGQPAIWSNFQEVAKRQLARGEGTGFPLILVILLAAFGTLVAALAPLALVRDVDLRHEHGVDDRDRRRRRLLALRRQPLPARAQGGRDSRRGAAPSALELRHGGRLQRRGRRGLPRPPLRPPRGRGALYGDRGDRRRHDLRPRDGDAPAGAPFPRRARHRAPPRAAPVANRRERRSRILAPLDGGGHGASAAGARAHGAAPPPRLRAAPAHPHLQPRPRAAAADRGGARGDRAGAAARRPGLRRPPPRGGRRPCAGRPRRAPAVRGGRRGARDPAARPPRRPALPRRGLSHVGSGVLCRPRDTGPDPPRRLRRHHRRRDPVRRRRRSRDLRRPAEDARLHPRGLVPRAPRPAAERAPAAEGDCDEPPLGGRCLRRSRRRLPVGVAGLDGLLVAGPHRHDRAGARPRGDLRPLDGLRGLPPDADPRAIRRARAERGRGRRGPGRLGPDHHERRARHGRRLRRVRPRRGAVAARARGRARRRRRARRDDRPPRRRAGDDAPARRLELVGSAAPFTSAAGCVAGRSLGFRACGSSSPAAPASSARTSSATGSRTTPAATTSSTTFSRNRATGRAWPASRSGSPSSRATSATRSSWPACSPTSASTRSSTSRPSRTTASPSSSPPASSTPTSSGRRRCSRRHAPSALAAFTTSRPARSTATCRSIRTRPSRRSPRIGRGRPTTRRRPAPITPSGPTSRPTACRSRSRTARTTTGHTSSRRR